MEMRGGTVTFNCYDPDGHLIDYRRVEELASAQNISLRTGCFCNPGAGEIAHGLTPADMDAAFAAEGTMTYVELIGLMEARGKGVSAVRISTGLATTFADVYRFMAFVAQLRDQSVAELGAPAAAAGHAQPDTA
jgi:selenocysteine lyase/cysteine desulfurase